MTKTITLPDGSKETFEGTVEELVELERKLREGGPRTLPTGKRILNEDVKVATDDVNTCECKLCEATRGFMKDFKKTPQLTPLIEPWVMPFDPVPVNPYDRTVDPLSPYTWPNYFKAYWTTNDSVTLKCGN